MEKGVYDMLKKKYLRTLLFSICEAIDGPIIEDYAFSFSYPNANSQEVCMNFNCTGNKKQGGTFKCNSTDDEVAPNQMKSSACKMIRTLVQLMRTLGKMPDERTILMKLYYDDVRLSDYEPPFFRGCTEEGVCNLCTKNPFQIEAKNVNSKHFVLALKVKSVLNPCEDDNEVNNDESVSLGADSVQRNDTSDSGSEVNSSQENQYIVQPVDKQQPCKEDAMVSQGSDDRQDPVENENQLSRVKERIIIFGTVEFTDVLAHFPDISVVLIEEIMDKLVQEGFLIKSGKDAHSVNRQKDPEHVVEIKKEIDDQVPQYGEKTDPGLREDYLYMKALYHALPMDYISISKLQSKLNGEANQTTVKKLIDKMTQDGFVEAKRYHRLGKHVIHSVAAEKLHEVRQALDFEAMDVDVNALQNKLNHAVADKIGNKKADGSTCGVLHSIGYDIACMQARSEFDTHQKGSLRSDQYISKTREIPYNPTSKTVPADSRESTIPGSGKTELNGQTKKFKAGDIMCSRPSQDKRSRKASMGAMKMALLLLGWSLCLLLSISVSSEATTDPNDGSLIIPQHFQTIPNLRIGGNDFIRFPRKLLNMQKKRGKALETKVIIIMAFTLALVLVGKYQFGLRLSRQVLFKWLRLRIHRQAKPQAAEPPAELQVAEPPVELVRVPAAEHPRDPANCVLLLITVSFSHWYVGLEKSHF